MLEALEDSKKILDKFKITEELDISQKRVNEELNKLNERINKSEEVIIYFCNSNDPDIQQIYTKFSKLMFRVVNSHHTLKINNGLGDFEDFKYLIDIIREVNLVIDDMIFMWRG